MKGGFSNRIFSTAVHFTTTAWHAGYRYLHSATAHYQQPALATHFKTHGSTAMHPPTHIPTTHDEAIGQNSTTLSQLSQMIYISLHILYLSLLIL
jgi:hypothetical protein